MKKDKPVYSDKTYIIKTSEEMIDFGYDLSSKLKSGSVLCLTGSLGAGKTTLVKGLAKGLEISSEITSPSFTIIKEYYDGTLPLYHMDLYRIDNIEDLLLTGFEELVYGDGISVIEWSEKAEEIIPDDAISIKILITSEGYRKVFLNSIF